MTRVLQYIGRQDDVLPSKERGDRCFVCRQWRGSGIVVLHSSLCSGCQQQLGECDVSDIRYDLYIARLKELFETVDVTLYA